MKNVSAAFKTMLANNTYLLMCNLYTITLLSGVILYYTDAPQDIAYGGHTFLHADPASNTVPGFKRGSIKLSLGLQVESLDVTILYTGATRLEGMTPGAFANSGGFDGARVLIDKLLTTSFNDTTAGVVNLFDGVVSEVQANLGTVKMSVSSDLIYLNAVFPRNYFLPTCNWALFSTGCGLNKATFAVSDAVDSATSTSVTAASLTQASGYFALGYITFTSGALNGLTRYVKDFSGGVLTLLYPLPSVPAAGDTFTVYPGCDKTQNTCLNKFNNKIHFRGFKYVPTPEVIELGQAGGPPGDNSGDGAGLGGGGGIGRGVGGQAGRFEQR